MVTYAMNDKHTPGPWHVETTKTADTVEAIAVRDSNYGLFLAQVELHDIEHADALANARLMAAAPDLLAALRAIIEPNNERVLTFDSRRQYYIAKLESVEVDAARAAIAKAVQS